MLAVPELPEQRELGAGQVQISIAQEPVLRELGHEIAVGTADVLVGLGRVRLAVAANGA